VLVPSLALGAVEVPEGPHAVVDGTSVTFVGHWTEPEEASVRDQVAQLFSDPDYRVLANFPIVCLDPALQARVVVLLGANEAEIEAERDRLDHELVEQAISQAGPAQRS